MSYDIWGNPLPRGCCEVHPWVHEEYPCSLCVAERKLHEQEQEMQQCEAERSPELGSVNNVTNDRDELLAVLTEFIELTEESQGVAGWHLNGAIAEWGEFEFVSKAYKLIKRIEGGEQ